MNNEIFDPVIERELLQELPSFEIFFSRIGFKRIDGSIYGLLTLAKKPLTSEEIEETLNLSQSAVSLSLKTLAHFGAIETTGDRDNPGSKAKLHSAKEDSLSIVASVFRKREEEMVADFKAMAQRILDKSQGPEFSGRKKRMLSIISTCEIAESVMKFVINMAHHKKGIDSDQHYDMILKRLPKAFDLIANTAAPIADITLSIKENLTEKFKNNLKGIYEKR